MYGFKRKLGVALLFSVLAFAACSAPLTPAMDAGAKAPPSATQSASPLKEPAPEPPVSEGALDASMLPPAALEAQRQFAGELAVDLQSVSVLSVEAVNWPDSCLGLINEGEMCAAVITPGYRMRLSADGRDYLLHTNEDGSRYRIADAPTP